jgi:hypothetical protein
MTDRRRPNPVTRATLFRTYRVDEELRKAVKERRLSLGLTVRAFVAHAIETELAGLLEVLAREIPAGGKKGRPARLPLTEQLLHRLQEGCEAAELPVSRLLLACLRRAAARKHKRKRAQ